MTNQTSVTGNSSPSTRLERWVYLCFFLSGMNALIYEVSWLNRIQLVMGHTIYSLSTTLAAYMSGLALGSLFVPRLKKSGISSLRLYLIAELLIGLYGLAFFPLLKLTQIPYGFLVSNVQFSLLTLSFIQFVFCTILIIIPTFLMGTTLPLIAPFIYPAKNEISERIPTLYGINTLGAMVGSFAAGYVILPTLGYSSTIRLAAAINIGLYFMVTFFGAMRKGRSGSSSAGTSNGALAALEDESPFSLRTVKSALAGMFSRSSGKKSKAYESADRWSLIVLFVSGFVSMIMQVIWGRLASLSFGPSVYIFPLVTCVVLGGIVLGSWLWRKISGDIEKAKRMVIVLPLVASIALILGNYLFTMGPRLVVEWNQKISPGFWLRTVFEFSTIFVCLLPAATAVGALFPAAMTLITRGEDAEEGTRSVGHGYALNIAGLMFGALLGSFVLLPYFGIEGMTNGLVILLFTLSAGLAFGLGRFIQAAAASWVLGWIIFSIVPAYNWNELTAGHFYNRKKKVPDESLRDLGWMEADTYFRSWASVLVDRTDGPEGTISIHQGKQDKNYKSFKVNGKVDGTNSVDLKTTRLLSAYPALVKSDARSALIIGLGTGSSAAQALRFPNMQKVKVVELSASMIEYARKHFAHVDGDIWNDPRFSVEHRDGRDYLEHAPDQYDIIISEPSNPWVDGVASLFTEEYYQALSNRLSPGGVASLWFHSYGLDCEVVQSVLGAAARSFGSVLTFTNGGDLFLLASKEQNSLMPKPLPKSMFELERILFEESGVGYGANEADNYKQVLQKSLIYDREDMLESSEFAPVNRDDNQFLQFRSGKTFALGINCRDFPGSSSKGLVERYSIGLTSR